MGWYITCKTCKRTEKYHHPDCGCRDKEVEAIRAKIIGSTVVAMTRIKGPFSFTITHYRKTVSIPLTYDDVTTNVYVVSDPERGDHMDPPELEEVDEECYTNTVERNEKRNDEEEEDKTLVDSTQGEVHSESKKCDCEEKKIDEEDEDDLEDEYTCSSGVVHDIKESCTCEEEANHLAVKGEEHKVKKPYLFTEKKEEPEDDEDEESPTEKENEGNWICIYYSRFDDDLDGDILTHSCTDEHEAVIETIGELVRKQLIDEEDVTRYYRDNKKGKRSKEVSMESAIEFIQSRCKSFEKLEQLLSGEVGGSYYDQKWKIKYRRAG